jgi:hypothetical protein
MGLSSPDSSGRAFREAYGSMPTCAEMDSATIRTTIGIMAITGERAQHWHPRHARGHWKIRISKKESRKTYCPRIMSSCRPPPSREFCEADCGCSVHPACSELLPYDGSADVRKTDKCEPPSMCHAFCHWQFPRIALLPNAHSRQSSGQTQIWSAYQTRAMEYLLGIGPCWR